MAALIPEVAFQLLPSFIFQTSPFERKEQALSLPCTVLSVAMSFIFQVFCIVSFSVIRSRCTISFEFDSDTVSS